MLIEVWIPAIGNVEMLQECITRLIENSALHQHGKLDVYVIDNGSESPIEFARLRNEKNVGMVEALAQAKANSSADILIYQHSDFMVYEKGWDVKIRDYFIADTKLGLVGAMGAQQADTNGGRSNCYCAFDGSVHGHPCPKGITPVVLLDGCLLAMRTEAMRDCGIPDITLPPFHFYDKYISCQFVERGWRVGVTDLDCHHRGGKTSCQPECQKSLQRFGGEQSVYNEAEQKYLERFGSLFPMSVDAFWNYRTKAGPVFNSLHATNIDNKRLLSEDSLRAQ